MGSKIIYFPTAIEQMYLPVIRGANTFRELRDTITSLSSEKSSPEVTKMLAMARTKLAEFKATQYEKASRPLTQKIDLSKFKVAA